MKKILPGLAGVLMMAFMFSCQKGIDPVTGTTDTTGTTTPSQLDLLRDSIYLYTKEVYLWHSLLPSYDQFNPRQFTGSTDLEAAQNEMTSIRSYAPEDKSHSYSFVVTNEESDGLQTGESKDWGFLVKGAYIDQAAPYDSVRWFVNYVYKNSSAGLAGVTRGWILSKINNTALGYDDASISLLNSTFFGNTSSANFEFTKPDGTTQAIDLSTTSFTENSVLYSHVYNSDDGTKKIGYVVFNQFLGEPSRTELNTVFTDFKSQGISELIVDLRYNGGGSTATQETFAELIAPASTNGKTMYTYYFNDSLQADKFPLLQAKYGYANGSFKSENNVVTFENSGGLNLSHVFFIVSGQTVSASELLINNLKPYMDVKLIGDTTYGKPVGFFPISIFDYSIYPVSFKTANSVGNTDYFSGFPPDKLSPDGVNKDWGDVDEPCLYYALKYINTGSFRMISASDRKNDALMKVQQQLDPVMRSINSHKFNGMFKEKK